MTPLELITRRQYLEEELALAAATHQYVLDRPAPTRPVDRDARDARDALLDRLRARWTDTLDCLTRTNRPRPRRRPRVAGPRQGAGEARRGALRRTR